MTTLSGRERFLIGAAVLVAVVLGVYLYAIEPLREQRRTASELIPAREATLERRRILVAQRPALEAQLKEVDERIQAVTTRLLKGPTPALAASELETLVKETAQALGIEVRSTRVLNPADRDALQEIPLEVLVAAGLRETVRLLYELERNAKLLRVQAVSVRVVAVGQPKDLLTTLTVSGYLFPGGPSPVSGAGPPTPRG